MLAQLRRAAGELLTSYAAAVTSTPPGAAAASGAALRLPLILQQARLAHASGGSGSSAGSEEPELQPQPFSLALRQLEAAVTEQVLPPEALEANRQAMATVKEFARSLEHADTPTGYPSASIKNVSFTFRDPYAGGRLNRVRCQLKTTGGNCAGLVQRSLATLLQRLGLNPYFYFDGSHFQPRAPPKPQVVPKPRPAAPRAAQPTAEEVQAVRARAAAAGFPSQNISEEQFRQMEAQSEASREEKQRAAEEAAESAERMKRIDPLLAAVAALPWLAEVQGAEDRVKMIKSRVLDELEGLGWDIRGPARRIWSGERSLATLTAGKDAGSREAIKAVLFHAVQNDKKYGHKVLRPGQTV
ncbi:hypothetical protein ABPG77_000859 [Micractinium sp. CCAP 211/92]